MELYALVKFNAPIREGVIASYDSFEMEFSNGKRTKFSFTNQIILNYHHGKPYDTTNLHLTHLDVAKYPDSEFLEYFEGTITAINNFDVFAINSSGLDINPLPLPIELLDLKLYNRDLKYIHASKDILNKVFVENR